MDFADEQGCIPKYKKRVWFGLPITRPGLDAQLVITEVTVAG